MSVPSRRAIVALALVLVPPALSAQAGPPAPSVADAAPAAAGPTAAGPRLGLRQVGIDRADLRLAAIEATLAAIEATPAAQPAAMRKRGMPQMVIGGAALVGGAIVGGDVGAIVMLGGLGYGLYGLYLYLQ